MADDKTLEIWHIDDLIMSATSYYLGRQTAMVDAHCNRLVAAWPTLPEAVRDYIQRIVESAFRRDDRCRKMLKNGLPLGQDCDRESWEKVRAMWNTDHSAY